MVYKQGYICYVRSSHWGALTYYAYAIAKLGLRESLSVISRGIEIYEIRTVLGHPQSNGGINVHSIIMSRH